MKVNLLHFQPETAAREGYLNLDAVEGGENSEKADIRNLDVFVDDSECMEILAEDVVNFMPYKNMDEAIEHWVKKLRKGGTLTVGGVDLMELSKIFIQRNISTEEWNQIMGDFPSIRISYTTSRDIINALESHGLKIIKKRINGIRMVVEAQRP